MKLSSLLKPELVLLNMPCKTRDELVDGLIRELYRGGHTISVPEDAVRGAVTDREKLRGTLLPTGLAIPHARIEGVQDLVVILGVPQAPIAPERGDTPIRMMVLMLVSQSASTQYLNTLAAFAKISQGPLFTKLCAAENPAAFIKTLGEGDVDIAQKMTVASIMNTALTVLRPDNTVKEAADMFYKNRLDYLPVLDSKDAFVGELTVVDLFAIGIPDYASKMANLKFLTSFEPFEELLKKENSIRIGEVMKKPEITLDEDSPVVEAILKFIRCKRPHLPVVKNKTHLSGVVGYMDILKKVLRA